MENLPEDFRKRFLEGYERHSSLDPDAHREVEFPVSRHIWRDGDAAFLYSISSFARLPGDFDWSSVVRREKALADSRHRNFEWRTFEAFSPPELDSALQSAGYRIKRESALLYFPMTEPLDASPPSDIEVVQPRTIAEAAVLHELAEKVHGPGPRTLGEILDREISQPDPKTFITVALKAGQPVSGAWLKAFGSIGHLFGGMTVREYRGQGAYRALVKARYGIAADLGLAYLVVEAGPLSLRVLSRLGFRSAGYSRVYVST